MLCPDVNILVNAFRSDSSQHLRCKTWLETLINGPAGFALLAPVVSGFLRIVTHPRVFREPSPLDEALAFCEALLQSGRAHSIGPQTRHWTIFSTLCRETGSRGNLIPDAWFASVVIENGCEWVTLDRDYARFPGLRWRDLAKDLPK